MGAGFQATCPECGSAQTLVRERWIPVHVVGSSEYAYPRGPSRRCPGSFMPMNKPGVLVPADAGTAVPTQRGFDGPESPRPRTARNDPT